jgi:hypothetical protein
MRNSLMLTYRATIVSKENFSSRNIRSHYCGSSAVKHTFDLCSSAFYSQICDNAQSKWLFSQETKCNNLAAFNKKKKKKKKKTLFTSKLNSNLGKKLVKCYIWIIAVFGAETWTFRKVHGKFWNVMLEQDGEDQLDRSSEKWRSVTKSQGGEDHPTNNKKKESSGAGPAFWNPLWKER